MQIPRKFPAIVFFVAQLFCTLAESHPLDLGLLNLIVDGANIHARLELNPSAGARLLKVDLKDLTPSELSQRKEELFQDTIGAKEITIDAQACAWKKVSSAQIENPQLLSLEVNAKCPKSQGRLQLEVPFLKNLDTTYRLLAMTKLNGVEHVGGADPLHPVLTFSLEEASYGFGHFVGMGIDHIGVSPGEWHNADGYHLPYGIDHILFVIAILLCGGTLLELLKTITGFTIGHTTSLALVTFGIVRISGSWIEAAIALTIAYIAAMAALRRQVKHRVWVTMGIGLIHGLGFANALMGLHLNAMGLLRAVIGFNCGVELGQAVIILITLPILHYLRRYSFVKRYFIPTASALIFLISMRWFVLRAFG